MVFPKAISYILLACALCTSAAAQCIEVKCDKNRDSASVASGMPFAAVVQVTGAPANKMVEVAWSRNRGCATWQPSNKCEKLSGLHAIGSTRKTRGGQHTSEARGGDAGSRTMSQRADANGMAKFRMQLEDCDTFYWQAITTPGDRNCAVTPRTAANGGHTSRVKCTGSVTPVKGEGPFGCGGTGVAMWMLDSKVPTDLKTKFTGPDSGVDFANLKTTFIKDSYYGSTWIFDNQCDDHGPFVNIVSSYGATGDAAQLVENAKTADYDFDTAHEIPWMLSLTEKGLNFEDYSANSYVHGALGEDGSLQVWGYEATSYANNAYRGLSLEQDAIIAAAGGAKKLHVWQDYGVIAHLNNGHILHIGRKLEDKFPSERWAEFGEVRQVFTDTSYSIVVEKMDGTVHSISFNSGISNRYPGDLSKSYSEHHKSILPNDAAGIDFGSGCDGSRSCIDYVIFSGDTSTAGQRMSFCAMMTDATIICWGTTTPEVVNGIGSGYMAMQKDQALMNALARPIWKAVYANYQEGFEFIPLDSAHEVMSIKRNVDKASWTTGAFDGRSLKHVKNTFIVSQAVIYEFVDAAGKTTEFYADQEQARFSSSTKEAQDCQQVNDALAAGLQPRIYPSRTPGQTNEWEGNRVNQKPGGSENALFQMDDFNLYGCHTEQWFNGSPQAPFQMSTPDLASYNKLSETLIGIGLSDENPAAFLFFSGGHSMFMSWEPSQPTQFEQLPYAAVPQGKKVATYINYRSGETEFCHTAARQNGGNHGLAAVYYTDK